MYEDMSHADFRRYQQLQYEYRDVFDEVLNQFIVDMFGEFSSSVHNDEFIAKLRADGWKYFDRRNLNQLFFEKLKEFWDNDKLVYLKERIESQRNAYTSTQKNDQARPSKIPPS